MSDYIPFEMQSEIMKRLPIKSLIQFRSVSKKRKSLIDSSKFISDYHLTQPRHHLFVGYIGSENNSSKDYISVVDDDSFPKEMFSLTIPLSVKLLDEAIIVSSQGLLCFYGTKAAVIWNPPIRKSYVVHVPNVLGDLYETILGFGVCPSTCDPTLVKITLDHSLGDTTIDVFTLSTKTWKRLANSLPRKSIAFTKDQVVIDRFIYWGAFDTTNLDAEFGGCYVILSFDMITEEFKELKLQDTLAVGIISYMCISKWRESLAVLLTEIVDNKEVTSVWVMDNGDKQSVTKKFTINMSDEENLVLGFRKSGEPIIEMIRDHIVLEDLFVYEPYSEHINCIVITTITEYSCNVSSYMESLLLLDL